MKYPYYIVQGFKGRLQCPLQHRHTPVEKMFHNGKIGGSKMHERVCYEIDEVELAMKEFAGYCHTVRVYIVPRQGSPRQGVPSVRALRRQQNDDVPRT
jgi:hypothetical protein